VDSLPGARRGGEREACVVRVVRVERDGSQGGGRSCEESEKGDHHSQNARVKGREWECNGYA
jgi:hypothetical protein